MDEQGIFASEKSVTLSEQRWEDLVGKVKFSLECIKRYDDYIAEDEINLIVSVLKNNIPFTIDEEGTDE